jgi:hypothetical protein
MGMNHRAGLSTPSEHARHDQLLMARLAGDDHDPSERSTAEALRSACAECRQLHDDLRTLMQATADLPIPRRHRDFRLSPEQAARLRGSWRDRVMERLAAPSLGVLQPLAGAAMAIGLTLLVVNSLPFGFGQSSGATASPQAAPVPAAEVGAGESPSRTRATAGSELSTDSAATLAPAPFTSPTPSYRAAAGTRPSPTAESLAGGEFAGASADEGAGEPAEQGRDRLVLETSGPDWLLIGVLLIIAGLAVFLARVLAVRQMRDPRLQ